MSDDASTHEVSTARAGTARRARVRRRAVWIAPVLVAGAVAAGAAVASSSASASPTLTPRSPAQLLAAIGTSGSAALSGTISQSSDLGLPSLPGNASSASLSWQSFITGSHSIRIWVDGADRQRLAVIGQLSEADVIHDGKNLWTYTSDTNSVTHTVLGDAGAHHDATRNATEAPMTPSALADRVLKAVDPTTSVTVGPATTVAGRSAYTLVVRPRTSGSTVREVTIAVDASKFVPLQVNLFGASSTPAVHLAFTDISFATPPAKTFAFTTPAGASVSSNPFTAPRRHHRDREAPSGVAPSGRHRDAPRSSPSVLGTGWTSVVELHDGLSAVGGLSGLLDQATTSVGTTGARLLHTALVNAVILPDGRVFVGAVQPSLLEHVAATTPR